MTLIQNTAAVLSVDIPDEELSDLVKFTKAKTKKERS